MKLQFQYNKEKDVWCLLNKGKSSSNSQTPTKQYELLIEKYGENPTVETASVFVDEYILESNMNISKSAEDFQKGWSNISSEFQKRAEAIFKTTLPHDITAYLTINSRCPYSIKDNFFYVSLQSKSARKTAMHELWHFYTWYGLGSDQEEKLGKQKYNEIKEALTVLLNVECKDLLPDGVIDSGYPQHQELRQKIVEFWKADKDINKLWTHFTEK